LRRPLDHKRTVKGVDTGEKAIDPVSQKGEQTKSSIPTARISKSKQTHMNTRQSNMEKRKLKAATGEGGEYIFNLNHQFNLSLALTRLV